MGRGWSGRSEVRLANKCETEELRLSEHCLGTIAL